MPQQPSVDNSSLLAIAAVAGLYLAFSLAMFLLNLAPLFHLLAVIPVGCIASRWKRTGGMIAGLLVMPVVVLDYALRWGNEFPHYYLPGITFAILVLPVVGYMLGLGFEAYAEKDLALARLHATYKATEALHQAPDLGEVLQEMVRIVVDDLGFLDATISIGKEKNIHRRFSVNRDQKAGPSGLSGTGRRLQLPIESGPEVMGTLTIHAKDGLGFDQEEMRILKALAGQTAVAIEKTRLLEEARRIAITDAMTGLFNYRYFREKLQDEVERAKRYNRNLAVIMLDMDDFKAINDTHGHLCGDRILRIVARLLKEAARQADIVCRYGGEEFALILPETSQQGALAVAERIRDKIQSYSFEARSAEVQSTPTAIRLTASLGVATFGEGTHDWNMLINMTDKALYLAKGSGKNTIRVTG